MGFWVPCDGLSKTFDAESSRHMCFIDVVVKVWGQITLVLLFYFFLKPCSTRVFVWSTSTSSTGITLSSFLQCVLVCVCVLVAQSYLTR